MRLYIDLVSSISESVVYQGADFVILHNPSVAEIKAIRTKAKHKEAVRAILSPTGLFVWDGYHMTHHDAAQHLGIPREKKAQLHLRGKRIEWDVDQYDGSNDDELRAVHYMIATNPTLNRLYGDHMYIMGTDMIYGPDRPFDLDQFRSWDFFYDDDGNPLQ